MSKKARVLLVVTILVVALAVSSTVFSNSASNSDKIAEGAGLQGSNESGMKIYQQSERADYWGPFRVIEKGMAIYHESERNLTSVGPVFSNEEGLAIYLESERNSNPVQRVGSREEGMAIYHESERYTAKPAVRLYDGKPFNAYQRSEWLGADQ